MLIGEDGEGDHQIPPHPSGRAAGAVGCSLTEHACYGMTIRP